MAISKVTFTDIRGTSKVSEIIKIDCSEVTYCKDIIFDKIDITTCDGKKPVVECFNVHGKSNDAGEVDGCFK